MSEAAGIEAEITNVVAEIGECPARAVDPDAQLHEYVDSLALLELREVLERAFHVKFYDETAVRLHSIRTLAEEICARRKVSDCAPAPAFTAPPDGRPQTVDVTRGVPLGALNVFADDLEIGMPVTGGNNLAEGPLLQRLGDIRWRHISVLSGTPSKQIIDADGDRLYPTFFYVEMAFPEAKPMAAYGENDRFRIVSTLTRFGSSMIDGISYLLPAGGADLDKPRFDSVASAVAVGVPAARLANIFVKQFDGAAWLRKSRPAVPGFTRISEAAVAPDCYAMFKRAEKEGCFARPSPSYIPLGPIPVTTEYRLIRDRDLNGAGLVYFANYPVFLDIAEREVLTSLPMALPHELLDRRTLVWRKSAYLNNASSRDTLCIQVQAWIENTVLIGDPAAETAPIRLFLNYRMHRQSDGRLMMVSTARKIICGHVLGDLPFFAALVAAGSSSETSVPLRRSR